MDAAESTAPTRVLARATVNLVGLACGAVALVDPENPWIAELLEHEYLVELEPSDGGEVDARGAG